MKSAVEYEEFAQPRRACPDFFGRLNKKMNKEQKDEECDATKMP